MILAILYGIYIINCLVLIFLVLIQQSRGGGLAGAFGGGGGSDTVFGYSSLQKIGRWTIYAAIVFIVLSFLIANLPYESKMDSVLHLSGPQPTFPGTDQPVGDSAGGRVELESGLPPAEGNAQEGDEIPPPPE